MKTTVSIPDDVFAGAERLAHRMQRSRSAVDAVTEAMNSVMEQVGGSGADPFVSRAARNTLEQVEW